MQNQLLCRNWCFTHLNEKLVFTANSLVVRLYPHWSVFPIKPEDQCRLKLLQHLQAVFHARLWEPEMGQGIFRDKNAWGGKARRFRRIWRAVCFITSHHWSIVQSLHIVPITIFSSIEHGFLTVAKQIRWKRAKQSEMLSTRLRLPTFYLHNELPG